MTERSGFQMRCDRYECSMDIFERTEAEARERAERTGWTKTEGGRDFCGPCSEIRAKRKRPSDVVPDGVPVMSAFEAAEAAGFSKMYETDDGEAHFFCCGQEVEYDHFIGSPYGVRCKVCGTAIADVFGPSFKGATVRTCDPDKVDVEDPRCWVVVSDYNAALSEGGNR